MDQPYLGRALWTLLAPIDIVAFHMLRVSSGSSIPGRCRVRACCHDHRPVSDLCIDIRASRVVRLLVDQHACISVRRADGVATGQSSLRRVLHSPAVGQYGDAGINNINIGLHRYVRMASLRLNGT